MQNEALVKKEKSGFYITVNFYKTSLTLIRFGWIDASDWKPQTSPTGQMAGLSDEVYEHKLVAVTGDYELRAPVGILDGVGPKAIAELATYGISTIEDLLRFQDSLPNRFLQLREKIKPQYRWEQAP